MLLFLNTEAKKVWIRLFCKHYKKRQFPSRVWEEEGKNCLECLIMEECWILCRREELEKIEEK